MRQEKFLTEMHLIPLWALRPAKRLPHSLWPVVRISLTELLTLIKKQEAIFVIDNHKHENYIQTFNIIIKTIKPVKYLALFCCWRRRNYSFAELQESPSASHRNAFIHRHQNKNLLSVI